MKLKLLSMVCGLSLAALQLQGQVSYLPLEVGNGYSPLGQLVPKTVNEVKATNLTVGCEVLDRDYANYDEYKTYLPALGMKKIRLLEQKKAAVVGEYGVLYCLGFSSTAVKNAEESAIEQTARIISEYAPEVIYTHNPADKHDTHCAVSLRVIEALRRVPACRRPKKLLGCEVWRDLDWVNDDEKIFMDVSGHPNIAMSLASVFDSQIQGGKRYDLACDGRRLANATYYASHATDIAERANYAIDMTPLIEGGDAVEFISEYIDSFRKDVNARIKRLSRG